MILSFFSYARSEFLINEISELKTLPSGNPKISNSKLSSKQKIDKNVTRNRVRKKEMASQCL